MAKQEILIQLTIDGRAAWQVRKEIPRELCRKMTDAELEMVGNTIVNELGAIIGDRGPTLEKFAERGVAAQKAVDEASVPAKKKR